MLVAPAGNQAAGRGSTPPRSHLGRAERGRRRLDRAAADRARASRTTARGSRAAPRARTCCRRSSRAGTARPRMPSRRASGHAGAQPSKDFTSGWARWSGTSFAAPKVDGRDRERRRAGDPARSAWLALRAQLRATASTAPTCAWASVELRAEPRRVTAIADLVRAAAAGRPGRLGGDRRTLLGLVWATARAHRLSQADAADVAQTTWLRLVEHLDRDPRPRARSAAGWRPPPAASALRLIRRGTTRAADRRGRPVRSGRRPWRSTRRCSTASATARCGARFATLSDAARRCCGCSSRTRSRATRRSARRSGCRSARSGRPACAASRSCAERRARRSGVSA